MLKTKYRISIEFIAKQNFNSIYIRNYIFASAIHAFEQVFDIFDMYFIGLIKLCVLIQSTEEEINCVVRTDVMSQSQRDFFEEC